MMQVAIDHNRFSVSFFDLLNASQGETQRMQDQQGIMLLEEEMSACHRYAAISKSWTLYIIQKH